MPESYMPNEADVRFFHQNGYWVAPSIFGADLVERAREHMEMLRRKEFEKGEEPLAHYQPSGDAALGLLKIDNGWWADRVIERIATSAALGQVASALLGAPKVRLWHDQVLLKPGGGGAAGHVGWHQDRGYWASSSTADMLTAWVALDDVDESNGCMRVVPGSNHWGLVNESDFFNPDMEGQRERMRVPEGAEWGEVPLIMCAGQASFHHCMTLHGSGPNRTDRPRRSVAVHLMSGEARLVAGKGHANERVLGGRDGDPFAGPRFPLVWPAA
ncbi:MAG: phytanoyl-CoA dioxygenase family protein [Chthonomonadales bacterium]|nr:phytanoyl-CoA dioxygenase family protein [Chthonomonadales bacterium]